MTETTRAEFLQQTFKAKSSLPIRTYLRLPPNGNSFMELALVSLLRFCEDHVIHLAQQLQAPTIWHPRDNLQILNNALNQLNLLPTEGQTCV